MNLDNFRNKIPTLFATVVGLAVALLLAKLVGTGRFGPLVWAATAALYCVALMWMKEKIWIVVLLAWPLIGRIEILPIRFTPRDMAVMLAFIATLICMALKLVRVRPKFTLIDGIFLLNILWLAVSWVRNPVGVAAFDSDRVGGRPYFDSAIGVAAYWILARAVAGEVLFRRLPVMIVGVVFVFFVVNVALYFIPALLPIVLPFYSGWEGLDIVETQYIDPTAHERVRYGFFRDIGRYMSIFLCAYYPPVSLLNPIYLGRFLATVGTMVGLLLSGFRSFVAAFFGMFVLSSYFRGGIAPAVRAVVFAAVGAYFLMLVHLVNPLPFAAQRALAFIPEPLRVKLDPIAVEAGTESTRWRVEMWIQALTTDRYIADRWFGDGFGITKWQYNVAIGIMLRGGDHLAAQESVAVLGEFHSGPVSTIRVVGYVGLVFFMILLIMLARKAAQLIYACRGTPLFRSALFFCLPIVFEPFWFVFIFGGYNMAPAWAGLSLGVLKLVENSLESWRQDKPQDPETPELDGNSASLSLPPPLASAAS